MMQVVDLGIQSFKRTHPGGQCLLSRATVTLLAGENTYETNSRAQLAVDFDFNNTWVTWKRELTIDLHLEAYLNPASDVAGFVKEAVETVQNSLSGYRYELRISSVSHEYQSEMGVIVIHIAFVLSASPHRLLQILPGRLPRRVFGCTVDPHPPPGIAKATLAHVVVYMKSPRRCTPWDLLLTQLWLKEVHGLSLLTRSYTQKEIFERNARIVCLRPLQSSLLPGSRHGSDMNIGNKKNYNQQYKSITQKTERCSKAHEKKLMNKSGSLNELLGCSILSLISEPCRSMSNGVNKTVLINGPRLSEIAPALFAPGYYENISQRAGLVPILSKSITTIFRLPLTASSAQRFDSVRRSLDHRHKNCSNEKNSAQGSDFRAIAKCVVWAALQSGSYKVQHSRTLGIETLPVIFSQDDDLFKEELSSDYDSDEDMLSSTTELAFDCDEILSDEEDENEQDSGYRSLSLTNSMLDTILEMQSHQSETPLQADNDETELTFDSSSIESRAPPDMVMESDTVEVKSLPESIISGETIIEESSISIIASLANGDSLRI